MRSLSDLIRLAGEREMDLHEAILAADSEATGVPSEQIFELISSRLKDMRRSAEEASCSNNPCRMVPKTGPLLRVIPKRRDVRRVHS